MSGADLTVAVVGVGFGADFVPIYLSHPDVGRVIMVDPDEARRVELARTFAIEDGYPELDDALNDRYVDAVHILTPVRLHAEMVIKTLQAGKHVACAVPMATTLEHLDRIIATQQASRRTYMMMETTVFTREYFAVARMAEAGELGNLTLYRGFHIQNLDGFPRYWQGYPPMHYVTHALSPILSLLDTTVETVSCRGTGRLAPERTIGGFGNPYPAEVGLFSMRNSDLLADITMAFSQTARSYIEGFALYGDRRGIEWPIDNEGPLTVLDMYPPAEGLRGNKVEVSALDPPDVKDLLPTPLRAFVRESLFQRPTMPCPLGGRRPPRRIPSVPGPRVHR
jgi:predicted dehydrogenase